MEEALTICRYKEREIRTQVESRQTRVTHQLESAEGGTDQDTGRTQAIKRHSLSGECRSGKIRTLNNDEVGHSHPREHSQKDRSENGKEASGGRGILTA
jgi:hypothetical protein